MKLSFAKILSVKSVVTPASEPRNGVAILAQNCTPVATRRNLPGDAEDRHARYIEAAADGVLIISIHLPNGNPQPEPKFTYKLHALRPFPAVANHCRPTR